MTRKTVAVVVGRWQLVHQGQEALFQAAFGLADEVIAVLGSSYKARDPRNPFVHEERRQMLLAAIKEPDARKRLIDANTGGMRSDDWLSRLRDTSLAGTRPDALETYMSSWAGSGFADEIKPVQVPVRVIIGEKDLGAVPQRLRDTIGTWFPEFDLQILHGCGHYPMWEEPRIFAGALFAELS